ncbi:MAG: N-acetylmuramoyl-L-alanine amidase [Bernardetiaceae bacterium]|jgi:N-acetylmuramoyl-L-alanine amidase|nr:N-acetylmuramoyl-L-alanine amidase [Bernardetiaceae bacterium]
MNSKHLRWVFVWAGLAWGLAQPGPAQPKPAKPKPPSPQAQLAKQYLATARRYLVRQAELEHYFRIDERGIATFASFADKKKNEPECLVYWNELASFKNALLNLPRPGAIEYYLEKKSRKFTAQEIKELKAAGRERTPVPKGARADRPLQGYRIAIDPGHIAGDIEMAKIEQRFVILDLDDGTKISFCEGDLNLGTAQVLKEKLEKLGADVLLTRNRPNTGARGLTYQSWKKTELPALLRAAQKSGKLTAAQQTHLLTKAPDAQLYEAYFLPEDLQARARVINAYQPDLTVIIHYNGSPFPRRPWNKPVSSNYNMVFMPGAFLAGELASSEARFDFLRMLVLGNLEGSAQFAKLVLQEFTQRLQVPPVPVKNRVFYLNFNSIFVSQGVYARNLGLSRLVNSPLCYGESLYQDHEAEARLLNLHQGAKKQTSPRVRQVADAYYRAVARYFKVEMEGQAK